MRGPVHKPSIIAYYRKHVGCYYCNQNPYTVSSGFRPSEVRELDMYGFWAMAHEMRADYAMIPD